MKTKTLYLTDLDGTLLRGDQRLSRFACESLDALTKKGMIFSYATARSIVTARQVTGGLIMKQPVIVYNGSFILDSAGGEVLLSSSFSDLDSRYILDLLLTRGVCPIVYTMTDGVENFVFCAAKQSRGVRDFLATREGDPRAICVESIDKLYREGVFHFTCIDEYEKLLPLYEALRLAFTCFFHRDIYSGEFWLELHPSGASKASAALALKSLLGCNRLICFGDASNDIPMFEIADECYAVANACDELKAIATGVIASNEDDGVAKFLLERIE